MLSLFALFIFRKIFFCHSIKHCFVFSSFLPHFLMRVYFKFFFCLERRESVNIHNARLTLLYCQLFSGVCFDGGEQRGAGEEACMSMASMSKRHESDPLLLIYPATAVYTLNNW